MLEFRPHHFLCTLGFVGKGYSESFVKNFKTIAGQLREGSDGDRISIKVVSRTDAICAPCPSRDGAYCKTEAKIQELDQSHARILELKPEQVLTWGEAKLRIQQKMSLPAFELACAPCGWKKLGVCKTALTQLRAGKSAIVAISIFIFASGIQLLPTIARAETHAEAHTEPNNSIETVRDQLLKTKKSKQARALGKALDAIREKKYAQARKLAEPIQKNELFADYGYSTVGASYRAEAAAQVKAGNFTGAISNAQKAHALYLKVEASPYSSMLKKLPLDLGQVEIVLADAFAGKKSWKQAESYYERAFQHLASVSLLSSLRTESLGNYAQACLKVEDLLCDSWIQRFVAMYSKNSEENKAIAEFFPDDATRAAPAHVTPKMTQTYKAPDLDLAAFDAAMAIYLENKYSDAVKAFQKLLEDFPKSTYRYRARYWLGQALIQEKEREKAKKIFEELHAESPLTFYGLLSSFDAGKAFDIPIEKAVPTVKTTDPFLLPMEVLRLKRAENFVAEGLRDLAVIELRELKARDNLSSPFLMYLALLNYEAGNHNTCFSLLSELIQRGYREVYNSYVLRLVFPVVQYELIQKHAAQFRLDPILILSLIKQESAFDTSAVSSSGASGLMQLMPATAVDTDPNVRRADLVDADTNTRVGTKYLKRLMTRFNGNIVFSLAGYNAGPNAVERWIKEGKAKKGMLEFIEAIPYKETREYVASIIRNHYWYSQKLALHDEPVKPLAYFWNAYGPSELFGAAPVATPIPVPRPHPLPAPEVSPVVPSSPLPSAVEGPPIPAVNEDSGT